MDTIVESFLNDVKALADSRGVSCSIIINEKPEEDHSEDGITIEHLLDILSTKSGFISREGFIGDKIHPRYIVSSDYQKDPIVECDKILFSFYETGINTKYGNRVGLIIYRIGRSGPMPTVRILDDGSKEGNFLKFHGLDEIPISVRINDPGILGKLSYHMKEIVRILMDEQYRIR